MISVDEALDFVLDAAQAKQPQRVALQAAMGRTLAEDVASDVDSPPHDKSLVDGYAVQTTDFTRRGAREIDGPVELAVIEEVTAGNVPTQTVGTGRTTRVMTGTPIPDGADAVVMLEESSWLDSKDGPLGIVQIKTAKIAAEQNIMRRATSMRRGQIVLSSGTVIRSAEVGLLAEIGKTDVSVIASPTVAVLPTGSELVDAGFHPGKGKIRNSNGPMLLACAARMGAVAKDLGIGRDDPLQLEQLVAEGLKSDVLLISGGVSAGVLDLVPGVLEKLCVKQIFHKISLKPGKPMWFGKSTRIDGERGADESLVFGLPGNPVSSFVCFELFVAAALDRLAGRDDVESMVVQAELTVDYLHKGERPTYHPARFACSDERPTVELLPWHGSGDLTALAGANSLAVFRAGEHHYQVGDLVPCRLLR